MTSLATLTGERSRARGLTLTRVPEIGEKIDFIDTQERGVTSSTGATLSRSRRGTIDAIYPNGVGIAYDLEGYHLHAFLGWADVALQQRHTSDLLASLKGEEDPKT